MTHQPTKKFPYLIAIQEEGRGPKSWNKFGTLNAAQAFIKSHWQGAEYQDGQDGFHSDYATFTVVGFKMSDIHRLYVDEWGGLASEWKKLEAAPPLATKKKEQPISDEETEHDKEQGLPPQTSRQLYL
jgi:hypothetical protein